MAEDIDNPTLPSFGIQDTIEMGAGSAELLNDLLAPETSTGNPDEITPIVKEVPPASPPKKPEVPKGKEIVQKIEGEEEDSQAIIKNFLGDNDNGDDDNPSDDAPVDVQDDVQNTEPNDDSTYSVLTSELLKLGVFTTPDGEDETPVTTPEEFLERFKEEKKRGAIEMVDNFIGQYGEDYQNAFDAIFVKGLNPKEYFGTYNNIVDFTNLNLAGEENEANQIAVIKQALADQGFEQDDVTTEIERLKNYGDLETVATKHHKVLVKKEVAKLKQKEAEAEQAMIQKAAIKNQYINNVQTILQEKLKTKEFDGIPINPKLANELHDFLLVDKWKTPTGETLTDFDRVILDMKKPENHALKVKVALLLKILEKDPTLSTIPRTAVSKKSDELFGGLTRQVSKVKTQSSNSQQPKSWFNQQ